MRKKETINLKLIQKYSLKTKIMKQILLLVFIGFHSAMALAQSKQSVNYDAAKWKIWLIDKPEQITTIAPPGASETKAELQKLKQSTANHDDKKLAEIRYWDAAAPAYRWNKILPELVAMKQEVQLRMPGAWINTAIYDATILAWKEKLKYKRKRPADMDASLKTAVNTPLTYSYPCEHSATASAAATVMAYFFPEKADSILQLAHAASQSRIDAGVSFPSDVEEGWRLGVAVAKEIIEKAKNDGSAMKWTGQMNSDPKKWTGKFAMGATMGSFTPIVLHKADQFRPAAPPEFDADMKELKNFKQTFNSKSIAYYWASRADIWTDLAAQKIFEYRLSDDAPAVARIYAALSVAYHDAAIAIFDAKYTYWGIRPNQFDTTYKPLISTPPFPGYPSGHAAGSATSASVLTYFFPADEKKFRQLAQECADSRFYAGIHFRADNETALTMGYAMGKFLVENFVSK